MTDSQTESQSDHRPAEQSTSQPAPPREPATNASADGPWYQDGLRFRCTGCGDCCTGEPGAVWVTDEELQQIADHLGVSTGEVRLLHTRLIGRRTTLREHANGDCVFLDGETRHCSVYAVRPAQCRTWPFWNSNLRSPADWQKTCEECPGAGQGDFFSLEEIERQAAIIDI